MLLFDSNADLYSECHADNHGDTNNHYDRCGFTTAREGTATYVLVSDSLIRFSTNYVAIRFDIDRHYLIIRPANSKSDYF